MFVAIIWLFLLTVHGHIKHYLYIIKNQFQSLSIIHIVKKNNTVQTTQWVWHIRLSTQVTHLVSPFGFHFKRQHAHRDTCY